MSGNIDPGDRCFSFRCVEVADVWKDFDSGMRPYPPRLASTPRTPANQQSASAVWVSTPCGAASTRRIAAFVSGVLELYMYGKIYDLKMVPYPPRAALAPRTAANQQSASRWGFHTVRGDIDPGNTVFVPGLLEFYMHGRISDPGMGPYPPRAALALRTSGWGLAMSQSGVGVSTPCGVVSTWGIASFVPGLLEL